MKLLNRLTKYSESNSRPIYNPYGYPHIKCSVQDLIEGDTVGDLITEYQGIPSRLRRRTGQVKIDPIISSVLPILKNRDAVCKWMRWYFGAVVFDEGIHPEFVLPLSEKPDNKIPTPAQSFVKSFKTWLKS